MITSMQDALSLKGKTAIVTGGNRGIGKGVSLAMAQVGANIAIFCRDIEKAEETLEELKQYGGTYKAYYCDVTKKETVKKAVEDTVADFGRVEVLVNNSGIATVGKILDMDDSFEQWYRVIDTNLNGPFIVTYYVGRHMREMGGGAIVNMSSNSAFIVNKPFDTTPYNTAKAGLDRFTKCMAYELGPDNIRVNSINPGYTDGTDIGSPRNSDGKVVPRKAPVAPPPPGAFNPREYWEKQTVTGRFGTILEVGALAVFLASEAAEQITGATFAIDGGYSLAM